MSKQAIKTGALGIVLQVLYHFSYDDNAQLGISHTHNVIKSATAAQDESVCMFKGNTSVLKNMKLLFFIICYGCFYRGIAQTDSSLFYM